MATLKVPVPAKAAHAPADEQHVRHRLLTAERGAEATAHRDLAPVANVRVTELNDVDAGAVTELIGCSRTAVRLAGCRVFHRTGNRNALSVIVGGIGGERGRRDRLTRMSASDGRSDGCQKQHVRHYGT